MIFFKNIKNIFVCLYEACFLDKNIRDFISHNQQIWQQSNTSNFGNSVILFEYNTVHSSIISFSYLASVLKNKFNAKIVVYSIERISRKSIAEYWLRRILDAIAASVVRKIFISFGAQSFISVDPNKIHIRRAAQLFKDVYPMLNNKRDIENLTVQEVWIGDLIYDTYLRKYSVPTIDIQNVDFKYFLQQSLENFVFWQEYFDTHDVKAVNVSHCVYNNAMPLRIAVQNGIEVYQANASHVYRMNNKDIFAYSDYKYFPEIFSGLSPQEQSVGKREAKKRIALRFSGAVGVDMSYSTKSAYGEKKNNPILRSSNKLKILIAAHCFFDSPHSYGKNLFPDFYDWLDFLGQVSNETDYDWYIKTHPDYLPGNMEIIQYFLDKYPRFTLVDEKTSHHQLIEEGIGCALTTYGTIGFEYAALGVLVVNASECNPHISYNFNQHPKSVGAYKETLLHLNTQKSFKINTEEVYEYYYMNFIYNTEDWLFRDYQGMLKQIGGYDKQYYPPVYSYFLSDFTGPRHHQIMSKLTKFVESGDFRLTNT